MKSTFHLLLSFIVLSFLLSCQKNDNPTNISGKVKKISFVVTPSSGTGSTEYSYNSNGTLNQVINTGLLGYSKSIYTYSSSKIVVSTYNNLNTETIHYEFLLASNGLVDSSFSYFVPPNTVNSTKYIYNSNSEAIQQKNYSFPYGGIPSSPSEIVNCTYSNGNMTSKSHSTGFNYTYTYYSTVSNLTPEAYGLPYKLFQNTNLLKTTLSTDLSNPGNVTTYDDTYTFDSNSRVDTKTEKHLYNGTLVQEIVYTYTYY